MGRKKHSVSNTTKQKEYSNLELMNKRLTELRSQGVLLDICLNSVKILSTNSSLIFSMLGVSMGSVITSIVYQYWIGKWSKKKMN